MLFEETLDDGSELGIGGFGRIGRHAGDFSQYVASAVVAAAVVRDRRRIPAGNVLDALRLFVRPERR